MSAALLFTGCASASTQPSTSLPDAGALASLELVDASGQAHRLSEFQGKVVLLDFWATWCGPCLESLPLYDTWQRDLGAQGLVVVAVSVDEEDAPVATFAKRYAPNVTVLRDRSGTAAARMGLPKMPTAFVIGRDGAVIERRAGFTDAEATTLRASLVTLLAAP